jgi:hypothetical protein
MSSRVFFIIGQVSLPIIMLKTVMPPTAISPLRKILDGAEKGTYKLSEYMATLKKVMAYE